MNLKSHNRWIKEIGKYIDEENEDFIVRFALSYTLQSLRAGEDMHRFKWRYPYGYTKNVDVQKFSVLFYPTFTKTLIFYFIIMALLLNIL